MLAIYLVRLVSDSGLAFARKYVARVDSIYERFCKNKLQYKEFRGISDKS